MLETNEHGQRQIDELLQNCDSFDWTDWERGFIEKLHGRDYKSLSVKQKSVITDLMDKLWEK